MFFSMNIRVGNYQWLENWYMKIYVFYNVIKRLEQRSFRGAQMFNFRLSLELFCNFQCFDDVFFREYETVVIVLSIMYRNNCFIMRKGGRFGEYFFIVQKNVF